MSDQPDFDAADLADAILGETKTVPVPPGLPPVTPNYLGPILVMLLGLAVTLGIGLALQYNNDRAAPEPIRCDDLYASVTDECCDDDWVENWAPCRLDCEPEPQRDRGSGGLFDAEEHFADERFRDC